ncbi:MAG: tRNA (N6-threonylcarbamoyladenosine(37)-N6)-methyltransferase TrmO [Proteobacteria bacterium]|jgi:tRNA-Thr(GGU) m(6)t(6)A37 methyltransferase TsaA|nr:tRNA (N6-threonylcarbamoyladenosine(37)-N6)-methyltransferase TrmO [Alphaproteobacteria bacterium]NCC03395.1 tRNA (N6-threonylcarbamoyladenosine(37)-N6)-methyltransferase TrmO [Pseudomonadota bacterium]
MKLDFSFEQIGVMHTPYKDVSEVPRRPVLSTAPCTVEVFEEYASGLLHINGFSHLYLLSKLHLVGEHSLLVTPPNETEQHGVFATRSQRHPNSIGLSLVRLVKCDGRFLHIAGCDLLDQTPLLDIKPYRPEGIEGECRYGWFERHFDTPLPLSTQKSDQ